MKFVPHDKIAAMQQIDISADDLVTALLGMAKSENVCILDSCGVGYLGSHLLIAGIQPVSAHEISAEKYQEVLRFLDEAIAGTDAASVFTISYEFGKKLLDIGTGRSDALEPDVFLAQFSSLIIHDYSTGITRLTGDRDRFDAIEAKLAAHANKRKSEFPPSRVEVRSNFTRGEYLSAIETIKERIRRGDTYQTNLTQRLSTKLPDAVTPQAIFYRLRRDHPAPFAALIKRLASTVISASPERSFCIDAAGRKISTSPIKGTRPRGRTAEEDTAMRQALLNSEKDRAENTMIVDLLRNDLGRVCEYGSVSVEKLCDIEEHPTFYHLVSTISGNLRNGVAFSDILKAVFPCGSITGAPKISTMRIIDEIEPVDRGLSMGAIGYCAPEVFGLPATADLSVAIRTMVIRDGRATFNVGGGIVIDSDAESEYEETLTKAKALLAAINGQIE